MKKGHSPSVVEHDAFSLTELLVLDDKIESAATSPLDESGNYHLYVGTASSTVLMYRVTLKASLDGSVKKTAVEIAQRDVVGRRNKKVKQLEVIPDMGLIAVLADGKLFMLDMSTLMPHEKACVFLAHGFKRTTGLRICEAWVVNAFEVKF